MLTKKAFFLLRYSRRKCTRFVLNPFKITPLLGTEKLSNWATCGRFLAKPKERRKLCMLQVRGRPFDRYLNFKMILWGKLIFLPCDAEFLFPGPLLCCEAPITCTVLLSWSKGFICSSRSSDEPISVVFCGQLERNVLNSRLDLYKMMQN